MTEPTTIKISRDLAEEETLAEVVEKSNINDLWAMTFALVQYISLVDPYASNIIEKLAEQYSEILGGTTYEFVGGEDGSSADTEAAE